MNSQLYKRNIALAVVTIVLAAAAFAMTFNMPGQAPYMPRIVTTALFALGAGMLIRDTVRLYKCKDRKEYEPQKNSPAVVSVSFLIAYLIGFKYIGFYVTTLIIITAYMYYMNIRSAKTIAITAGIMIVFLYLLFTVGLSVTFPDALLI
ncbi:MAG: tripartite tricarboxylate transporter TctB family protein [Oscillospiraceae bacterium]